MIEVHKDMNRALDLAAIKGITVADATQLLIAAEHGRFRGLVDLGIVSAKYVDSSGNIIKANHSAAHAMAELDAKTAHGRDTIIDSKKQWNRLTNDWQDVASRGGPQLEKAISAVEGAVAGVWEAFDKLGKDNKLWGTIDGRLAQIARGTRAIALQLGIAEDTKPKNPDPLAFKLPMDQSSVLARRTALGQGMTQYEAEILREQKAKAAADAAFWKAFNAKQDTANEYLRQLAGQGAKPPPAPIVTVVLDPAQIASAIRRADRALR